MLRKQALICWTWLTNTSDNQRHELTPPGLSWMNRVDPFPCRAVSRHSNRYLHCGPRGSEQIERVLVDSSPRLTRTPEEIPPDPVYSRKSRPTTETRGDRLPDRPANFHINREPSPRRSVL